MTYCFGMSLARLVIYMTVVFANACLSGEMLHEQSGIRLQRMDSSSINYPQHEHVSGARWRLVYMQLTA